MFLLRCAWRRKLIVVLVFVAGVTATVAYFRLKKPMYRVETQLLAQRQAALPTVARGAMSDDPTRSAWEIVHRRENLVALVEHAQLASAPDPSGVELGVRRTLLRLGLREPDNDDDADPVSGLVQRLDRGLRVTTAEGTITIGIDWPHPQQAYAIVEGALQNFIEARHLQEVTAIDEVISVLHGRVATARKELDERIQHAGREAAQQRAGIPRATVPRSLPVSEELVRLKSMLDAKQRAIQDVEDFRRRRLAELQAQLDALQTVYSEGHPEMIRVREDVKNLSRESPQIVALRAEERKLQAQYRDLLAAEGRPQGSVQIAPAIAAPQPAADPGEENPSVREARHQYQQILDRVNGAQLELDAARAAFKYRYNVIWPPQVPTEPVSPNAVNIIGAGVIASLMMALGVGAALVLVSGRVVDRFQLERTLGLRVIAQLARK